MKRKLLSVLFFILSIVFVINVTAFTSHAEENTIVGTVVGIEFDDNDKVVAVTIDTADGFYDVSDNPVGKELLPHLDKKVKVTGTVGTDKDGNRIITITTYEILEE